MTEEERIKLIKAVVRRQTRPLNRRIEELEKEHAGLVAATTFSIIMICIMLLVFHG